MNARPTPALIQTRQEQLAVKNPELARSPRRLREKAKNSILAVLLAVFSTVLFAGGCVVAYQFAIAAIDQKQPLSPTLLASLLIPLAPGAVLGLITALRFDPDAGGVLDQFASTVGAVRGAVLGKKE